MRTLWWKLLAGFSMICGGCAYVDDAARTTFNETKASTLLKKYEWFKNAKAQVEAFDASIKVQRKRVAFLEETRSEWNRDDRQNWHQVSTELAGIISAYNNLASEYNAAMSKINYRFCNVGDLPAGASEPLPREFAPYKEQ